jgi:hypothetical protein
MKLPWSSGLKTIRGDPHRSIGGCGNVSLVQEIRLCIDRVICRGGAVPKASCMKTWYNTCNQYTRRGIHEQKNGS